MGKVGIRKFEKVRDWEEKERRRVKEKGSWNCMEVGDGKEKERRRVEEKRVWNGG